MADINLPYRIMAWPRSWGYKCHFPPFLSLLYKQFPILENKPTIRIHQNKQSFKQCNQNNCFLYCSNVNEFTCNLHKSIQKNKIEEENRILLSKLSFENKIEETKEMILSLTKHLDNIEELYNKLLKEHETRLHGQKL